MIKNIALALVSCAAIMPADTLILRSGASVDGAFVGGDNHSVRFLVGDHVTVYNLADIDTINFGPAPQTSEAAPPPAYPPAPQQPPPPQQAAAPAYPPAPDQPPAPQQPAAPNDVNPYTTANNAPEPPPPPAPPVNPNPSGIQVPAGAPVTVRLIDPVNSETDRLGQTYRASIDEPVVVNGYTVIPRGADAVVALVASQQAGKIEGQTEMTVALRNVAVNGRTYPVTTTGVVQAAASRSRRSAEVIGGTAAFGTLLGAIAGGGRGAAIGAVSGAAVGTAVQASTSGEKVKVPSETRLTFTLQNPLNL